MRTFRSVVLVVAVVLTASYLGVSPAAAEEGDPDVSDVGNTVVATDDEDGVPLGAEPPAGSTGTGSGPPPPGYVVDIFPGAPEGDADTLDECWGVRIADEGEAGLIPAYADAAAYLDELGDPDVLGACAAEETFDLVDYVNQSWRSVVQPPPPSPLVIAPGRAVTGLRSYLEIGGDPRPTTTLANPIGPDVVITMTPRYIVTWGDGASVETGSQGVPWPGGAGAITHVYTDSGDVTVTVQAYWTATWTAGGAGGALPELPTPTEGDLALPVEQYQARTD